MASDAKPKPPTELGQCCGKVWDSSSQRFYPCGKRARMTHEGKAYCGVHDPVARAERDAARQAKHDAKWERQRQAWDRQALIARVVGEVPDATLMSLDRAGGLPAILQAIDELREAWDADACHARDVASAILIGLVEGKTASETEGQSDVSA